jgi:hypothetical protein
VSWPKSAADEKVGSLWAPVGTSVSSGLRGFNISLEGHPVEGLGGLPTFVDSLLGGGSFACEAEGIS